MCTVDNKAPQSNPFTQRIAKNKVPPPGGRWWRQPPKGVHFRRPQGGFMVLYKLAPPRAPYLPSGTVLHTSRGRSPQPACKAKPVPDRTLGAQGRQARRRHQPSPAGRQPSGIQLPAESLTKAHHRNDTHSKKAPVIRLVLFQLISSFLSSRAASSQVLSAFVSLTTVFGMGTGVSSQLSPLNL